MSPNLAKYIYGLTPLQQHHKVGKTKKKTGPATKVALFGVFYTLFLSVLIFFFLFFLIIIFNNKRLGRNF
jgi:hypothetical protein